MSFYSSLLPVAFQESLTVRIVFSLLHCVVMGTRYSFAYYVFAAQFIVIIMASTMLQSSRYGFGAKIELSPKTVFV